MTADSPVNPVPITAVARNAWRTKAVLLLWAAGLAAADLAVKTLAGTLLSNGVTVDLGPINLRLLYNTGVAFSLGAALAPWLIIVATAVIILAMTWYAVSTAPAMSGLSRAGAALVLAERPGT